jgi:hypothetical protein
MITEYIRFITISTEASTPCCIAQLLLSQETQMLTVHVLRTKQSTKLNVEFLVG